MYGGNANFYNLGVGDYDATLCHLLAVANTGSWIIPSLGPGYGKAMDQAPWPMPARKRQLWVIPGHWRRTLGPGFE